MPHALLLARAANHQHATGRWVDVFPHLDFTGERRRFFAPAVIDGEMLTADIVSVRIAENARLRLIYLDGRTVDMSAGEAELSLRGVRVVQVLPTTVAIVDGHSGALPVFKAA